MRQAAATWILAGILALASVAMAKSDTRVESTRAVASSDGKKTVVVDRFTPVVDGEAERFSGRMLLRVNSADGSAVRQRYIEASQVRVIQPPVWLDGSRICAFVYNVAKNSNGIVYFDADSNRALQVEFVMPARQMAGSGTVEQELTSLEITEFAGADTIRTRNVPWKGGSAFPLVLKPLPAFQNQPYGLEFYNQVTTAMAAYKEFLKQHKLTRLEPEQASESFSADESWLALLGCDGSNAWSLAVPLKTGTTPGEVLPQIKMAPLPGVALSCSQHATNESHEPESGDQRYFTEWKTPDLFQVKSESYSAESDNPVVAEIADFHVKSGKLESRQGVTSSSAAAVAPPVETPADAPPGNSTPRTATPAATRAVISTPSDSIGADDGQ